MVADHPPFKKDSLKKQHEISVLDFLLYWKRPIRAGELKNKLKIKHSTLNSVLKRLVTQKLIIWEKYGSIELTGYGIEEANHITEHHVIIEKFFLQTLNISESIAHNEALHLAGAFSCEVIEAMSKKIGKGMKNISCHKREYLT